MCSIPAIHFCVNAFPVYTRDTDVTNILGTQVTYMEGFRYREETVCVLRLRIRSFKIHSLSLPLSSLCHGSCVSILGTELEEQKEERPNLAQICCCGRNLRSHCTPSEHSHNVKR